jgi:hypothetical protein
MDNHGNLSIIVRLLRDGLVGPWPEGPADGRAARRLPPGPGRGGPGRGRGGGNGRGAPHPRHAVAAAEDGGPRRNPHPRLGGGPEVRAPRGSPSSGSGRTGPVCTRCSLKHVIRNQTQISGIIDPKRHPTLDIEHIHELALLRGGPPAPPSRWLVAKLERIVARSDGRVHFSTALMRPSSSNDHSES